MPTDCPHCRQLTLTTIECHRRRHRYCTNCDYGICGDCEEWDG